MGHEPVTALSCTRLSKRYGGLVAVDEVSFNVERGQVLGIAGPNGSGKTTLLDVLSGHQRADGGEIELNGQDIFRLPAHRRARLGVGRTFQSPLVPARLTVGDTLRAAHHASSLRGRQTVTKRERELVHLHAPEDGQAGLLNTLDRRKLLLAALLVHTPHVLLLDEPCSGLIEEEIEEMTRVIHGVVQETGSAVVVVEHRLEFLFAVASRALVMDAGRVIADDTPELAFALPVVRAAYFDVQRAA